MGRETSKAHGRRLRDSIFHRYLTGRGLDIGCGDDPITPDCLRWDLPQGDAATLPGMEPESFDWVYSSHCLEDLPDPEAVLRRWWEVLKPGGCLLLAVPDEDLYEQGQWPSRFNAGHCHTFTAHKTQSWSPVSRNLLDLVRALPDHELLWLRRCDDGYDYGPGTWDRTHGPAEAALELMVRKQRSAGILPASPPAVSPSHPLSVASSRPLSNLHFSLLTSHFSIPTPADFDTALAPAGPISLAPLRIYTGLLGQIGDIVMATAAVRRIKELYPNGSLTFAVSRKYREAGELVAGLPYVDRLFVTELYFERLTPELSAPWELGWPADLRGDDEVAEQREHDLVFETRPRHRRMPWWEHAHQVEETAHMLRVPGPISRRTEVALPPGTEIPPEWRGKLAVHNDPDTDPRKAWPWESLERLAAEIGPERIALLGQQGPPLPGVLDLRGRTTLAQAAAVIREARCYLGVDSGLMWIAGSLQAPTVGLYGREYIPNPAAVQPENPRARYLEADSVADLPPAAVLQALRAHAG